MRYVPSPVPSDAPRGLRAWLIAELRRIAGSFANIDNLSLTPLAAEPERYENGDVVYADGANWNPGSGAGVYARESGAWVKL